MGKRQIAVRLLDSLLDRLDSPENVPLGERMTTLENRLTQLDAKLKETGNEN